MSNKTITEARKAAMDSAIDEKNRLMSAVHSKLLEIALNEIKCSVRPSKFKFYLMSEKEYYTIVHEELNSNNGKDYPTALYENNMEYILEGINNQLILDSESCSFIILDGKLYLVFTEEVEEVEEVL